MPHLNQRRARKPGEGRAKPNSKRRRSNKQKHDKERAAKLERETEELRIAMGGEPKDDPVIPGFTGHLTKGDINLVKEARRERWNTSQAVMDAIANRFGIVIAKAIRDGEDDTLLDFAKEYRQFVAQNQRDEIAQINVGKPINVTLKLTLVERRAVAAQVLSAELGKRCIPGIIGSDHRDEPGIGDELPGDDGNSEGRDEPV